MKFIGQAAIPETIAPLAFLHRESHGKEIIRQQFLDVRNLLLLVSDKQILRPFHLIYRTCQRRHNPAISTAPVAILPVRLLIRRNKIGITPPQTVYRIKQSDLSGTVARIAIQFPHRTEIANVLLDYAHFCIDGHGHLQGIYPRPIPSFRTVHHVIEHTFRIPQNLGIFMQAIQINIHLRATLVVGITCMRTSTESPQIRHSPIHGIFHIPRLWSNFVQSQQSLHIHTARPNIRGTNTVYPYGIPRHRVLSHETFVHQNHLLYHKLSIRPPAGHKPGNTSYRKD